MKRSYLNSLIEEARNCFAVNGWSPLPNARRDVTDFGLGDWCHFGLIMVNLAEEPEYCEKLMYAQMVMTAPAHTHKKKKEDIICRQGRLAVQIWPAAPDRAGEAPFEVPINHEPVECQPGEVITLEAGCRITLIPGIYHAFYLCSAECVIGDVSTANDDLNDNFFQNPDVGRYPGIEEDEPALLRLISESDS